jgi:uncharacterized protein (TIGR02246 family)
MLAAPQPNVLPLRARARQRKQRQLERNSLLVRKEKIMQRPAPAADVRTNDEQAIRQLVENWLTASKSGDITTLNRLMAEDVLFLTPGREPFGKEAFAAGSEQMKDIKLDADIDIKEIEVNGEWAWMRSFLNLTFTPTGGTPTKHSGHILTILRKQPDGNWVIARDANFVMPEKR